MPFSERGLVKWAGRSAQATRKMKEGRHHRNRRAFMPHQVGKGSAETEEELKLSLEKCLFYRTMIIYLRHVFSAEGIANNPEKLEAFTACLGWPMSQSQDLFVVLLLLSKICWRVCQDHSSFDWIVESGRRGGAVHTEICQRAMKVQGVQSTSIDWIMWAGL